MRKREHLVKIGDGNQILDLGLDPPGLVEALTFGTVAIATGVVEGTFAPAVIALLPVPAQSAGAARHHGTNDLTLVGAQSEDLTQVLSEDVSQLRSRIARLFLAVRHGPTPASPRPSVGRAGSSSD